MKRFLLIFVCFSIMVLTSACQEKPRILFYRNPVTKENVKSPSKIFLSGEKIYYLVVFSEKIKSRYLDVRVIKSSKYNQYGYKLFWSKLVRLSDEEETYFTDYFVIGEDGYYTMKIYTQDSPNRVYASEEFKIQK
ncbi:MAG: hypothetical protein R3Y28_08485 [Candidatus Gastranaerophilales bacterium]